MDACQPSNTHRSSVKAVFLHCRSFCKTADLFFLDYESYSDYSRHKKSKSSAAVL